jgi:(1->4)-alpha-D-glucan 1-alpha-D-glucosylmutase
LAAARPPAPLPLATYRVQLHAGFTFADAARIVPYLQQLGVSHVYASPILQARAGSTHGYDVIDPSRVSEELGGEDGLRALAAELRRHGMGLLIDIVPNHMAASADNPWWRDVLRRGEASPYADYFDLHWSPLGPTGRLERRLLLPVLGEPYGTVLRRGELLLVEGADGPVARYFDKEFPLADGTAGAADLRDTAPDAVHEVLERQHWRLAHWRLSTEIAGYRRFFDIGDLVGMRVERPEVFTAMHACIARLVGNGIVDGVRIDHPDGLFDPTGYLRRLRELLGDVHVVVEKILARDEELPDEWPVAGAVGYEFIGAANRLLVDFDGLQALRRVYERYAGPRPPFAEQQLRSRTRALDQLFAGELRARVAELYRLAAADRETRDLSPTELGLALHDVTVCLQVYRTYAREGALGAIDRARIVAAVDEARALGNAGRDAFDFVARTLLLEGWAEAPAERRAARLAFVQRWQQLTGPVMAKGFEDTALYRDHRLVSLNEVGGDPDPPRESTTVDAFHAFMQRRAARWPGASSATSTHDNKRSEDLRSRLHVLAEVPERWRRALLASRRRAQPWCRSVAGREVPTPNEQVLIAQTSLGVWEKAPAPELTARLQAYVVKAAREAKRHTSWLEPNEEHEAALTEFVAALYDERGKAWRRGFARLAGVVAERGALLSLAQLALKVASPGVPDFYQGSELWDLSLVDPDNRRPVDHAHRARLLEDLRQREPSPALCRELLAAWPDGRIKLWVMLRALWARRERRAAFEMGEYLPLAVRPAAPLCAFARVAGSEAAVCVVRTRTGRLPAADAVIELPPLLARPYRDALTGVAVDGLAGLRPAELLAVLPAALLVGESVGSGRGGWCWGGTTELTEATRRARR